jgi:hypothetical protein
MPSNNAPPAKGEATPQPYKVRRIHVVAGGADVLVREYTLDPGGCELPRCRSAPMKS